MTAWHHPPTRAAWTLHLVFGVAGTVAWAAVQAGVLVLALAAPVWTVWLLLPCLLYALYRFVLQVSRVPWAFRMRRVLRHYPWQFLEGVPRGLARHPRATDDGMWFEFPDPVGGEDNIPLVFLNHHRAHWWLKRIGGPRTSPHLTAQLTPLWFAGDPRFLGVVAVGGRSGPRRLHLLYQRPALDRRCAPGSWGATPVDLDRARRAGALVPAAPPRRDP
ncbi:hypothetical protein ACFVT5_03860 [Streptomyces sp. NPDC058001]|uniref:hypothetical protein n=1 Tax=Streptomyces sp. NPDC058001 TaxID=3346300 RepID=UPI0036E1D669